MCSRRADAECASFNSDKKQTRTKQKAWVCAMTQLVLDKGGGSEGAKMKGTFSGWQVW